MTHAFQAGRGWGAQLILPGQNSSLLANGSLITDGTSILDNTTGTSFLDAILADIINGSAPSSTLGSPFTNLSNISLFPAIDNGSLFSAIGNGSLFPTIHNGSLFPAIGNASDNVSTSLFADITEGTLYQTIQLTDLLAPGNNSTFLFADMINGSLVPAIGNGSLFPSIGNGNGSLFPAVGNASDNASTSLFADITNENPYQIIDLTDFLAPGNSNTSLVSAGANTSQPGSRIQHSSLQALVGMLFGQMGELFEEHDPSAGLAKTPFRATMVRLGQGKKRPVSARIEQLKDPR